MFERIDVLIQRIERSSDPAAQSAAREMVAVLLETHAATLAKMIELLQWHSGDAGAVLRAWAEDAEVGSLLLLHDLHPDDTHERIERALAQVRPYLDSHGGNVMLLEASAGVARLRMEGSCQGCPSSAATLASLIETAIYDAAPEIAAVEVEGLPPQAPAGLVQLQPSLGQAPVFQQE